MNNLPSVLEIEGELLSEVVITPEQMAKMNHARSVFRELQSILLCQIVPSLDGGWNNPLASQIECRLEAITFDSSNFLWKKRHVGAAHDAVVVGGAR
jgi:hypothetical protein